MLNITNKHILFVILIILLLFIIIIYPYTVNQPIFASAGAIVVDEYHDNMEFIIETDSNINNDIARTSTIINFISNKTDSYSLWLRNGNLEGVFLYRIEHLDRKYGDFSEYPHPIQLKKLDNKIGDKWKIIVYNKTNGFTFDIYNEDILVESYYANETFFGKEISFGSYSYAQNMRSLALIRTDITYTGFD